MFQKLDVLSGYMTDDWTQFSPDVQCDYPRIHHIYSSDCKRTLTNSVIYLDPTQFSEELCLCDVQVRKEFMIFADTNHFTNLWGRSTECLLFPLRYESTFIFIHFCSFFYFKMKENAGNYDDF